MYVGVAFVSNYKLRDTRNIDTSEVVSVNEGRRHTGNNVLTRRYCTYANQIRYRDICK